MAKVNAPAISIIAPMYNVEKYVTQCLDSILNQTFQDYELIVVDDCSTDNSFDVVESYIPRFDGRLRLVKLKKNSGGAGTPRNLAIELSRGEYIANIDSDDMFTKTAMEEFYTVAKETQADVVHAERHYVIKEDEVFDPSNPPDPKSSEKVQFVKEPTLETNDLGKRIVRYTKNVLWGYPWTKFCRRDFLIENNIKFPTIMTRDDIMFCFQCYVLAKNYVRTPSVVNIYRMREVSHSHTASDIKFKDYMNKWMSDIIEGVQFMNDFLSDIEFFVKNPQYKYVAIDHFMQEELEWYMKPIYSSRPPFVIELVLKNIFNKKLEDINPLMTYSFNAMNIYRLKYINSQYKIMKLQKQVKQLQQKLNGDDEIK